MFYSVTFEHEWGRLWLHPYQSSTLLHPHTCRCLFAVTQGLRESYNAGRPVSHQVGGNKKLMLILPPALVVSFFTPTINNIVGCLRGLKNRPTLRDLHRVFLVGGFSSCRLLQSAVRAELQGPGCPVVEVSMPDIAIVKGAVMFSTRSAIFTSRKARLTYGVGCSTPYHGGNPEHRRRRDAGKTVQKSSGEKVLHVFDKHISIDDDIPVGGVLSMQAYSATEVEQKVANVPIFVSCNRNPRFTDVDGCFELGGILVPFDMGVPFNERGFRVQLTFGGPELTVSVLKGMTYEPIENTSITLSQIPASMASGQ